jgi:hypothetical protein
MKTSIFVRRNDTHIKHLFQHPVYLAHNSARLRRRALPISTAQIIRFVWLE